MQIPSAKVPDIPESLKPSIDVPSIMTASLQRRTQPDEYASIQLLEEEDVVQRYASQKAHIVFHMAPNDGEGKRPVVRLLRNARVLRLWPVYLKSYAT